MSALSQVRVPSSSIEAWNALVDRAADLALAHPPTTLPQTCVSLAAVVLVEALGVSGAQLALRAVANELPEMMAEKRFASFDGAGLMGSA